MSETNLRMMVLDFKNGEPRDLKLYSAVQEWCKKNMDGAVDFRFYLKAWVALAVREDDPEYFEIMGVTCIQNIPDVPIFHIKPLEETKSGLRFSEQCRDMMILRLHNYLADNGQTGRQVLIYVSEKASRLWRRFFKQRNIVSADRYGVQV